MPEAEVKRVTDDFGELGLRIRVTECPTYARIERHDWHGVTACGAWHRRQGWYDALHVYAVDTVTIEKKWGDAACAAVVTIPAAAADLERGPDCGWIRYLRDM
jgi:hypothetical protein